VGRGAEKGYPGAGLHRAVLLPQEEKLTRPFDDESKLRVPSPYPDTIRENPGGGGTRHAGKRVEA
jgi:hypothetical protein